MNPNLPTELTFEFTMCSRCQRRYRALQFDSKSDYIFGKKPFYSLVWRDEHPDPFGFFITSCEPCQESARLLVYARTHLWRYGEVPAPLAELWSKAQTSIPDWPGFKRLSLTEKQTRDLQTCREPSEAELKANTGKHGRFLKSMEERRRNQFELVRPGAMSNLGLTGTGESSVIRCPNCREFVDASAKQCRFCNAALDSAAINTAVAQRDQEKATANKKEFGRMKVAGWLSMIAVAILIFVPAVEPAAVAVKWGVVLLLVVLGIAHRMR